MVTSGESEGGGAGWLAGAAVPPAPAAALGPSAGSGGQGGRAVRGRPRAGPAPAPQGRAPPPTSGNLLAFP